MCTRRVDMREKNKVNNEENAEQRRGSARLVRKKNENNIVPIFQRRVNIAAGRKKREKKKGGIRQENTSQFVPLLYTHIHSRSTPVPVGCL